MRPRQKGFTLIEALIVVAIAAVLASIAYLVLQKWILEARFSEVETVFNDLAVKQKAFFNDRKHYVANGWYPPTLPVGPDVNQAWLGGRPQCIGFDTIDFRPETPVYHQYRMIACKNVLLAPCTAGPCNSLTQGNFPQNYTGPGFILEALGDVNKDGNIGNYCVTSHSNKLVIWNNAEDWEGQNDEYSAQ